MRDLGKEVNGGQGWREEIEDGDNHLVAPLKHQNVPHHQVGRVDQVDGAVPQHGRAFVLVGRRFQRTELQLLRVVVERGNVRHQKHGDENRRTFDPPKHGVLPVTQPKRHGRRRQQDQQNRVAQRPQQNLKVPLHLRGRHRIGAEQRTVRLDLLGRESGRRVDIQFLGQARDPANGRAVQRFLVRRRRLSFIDRGQELPCDGRGCRHRNFFSYGNNVVLLGASPSPPLEVVLHEKRIRPATSAATAEVEMVRRRRFQFGGGFFYTP